MLIKCPKCDNEWNYQGHAEYYATCTNCRNKVSLKNRKPKPKKIIGGPVVQLE